MANFLGHLEGVRESRRGRILAVRGRRQVGKSTAVTRFVESSGEPYLYATGVKSAPIHRQLEALAEASLTSHAALPDRDLLFGSAPSSWREFLDRLALSARSGPIVVVLDEFPWLIEQITAAEGELQNQWDRVLENLPILLILVGSDVAMMNRLTRHDRPLFGRARPMTVPPLNPWEIQQALPESSGFEVFDAFLVTGGFPRLVSSCSAAADPLQFAKASLRDQHSELVVTAQLSLDAEFVDSESAYRVLAAIGGNEIANPGFTDVVSAISDPESRDAAKTATTRALTLLSQAKDLVRIETPAGSSPKSRLRRYRIDDPYLRFWFRFVERQIDNISRGRSDIALSRLDQGWSSWRGRAIEPVVQDALVRLGADDTRLAGVDSVGAWWNRDNSVEVDVVCLTSSNVRGIGTVKWRSTPPLGTHDVQSLKAQRLVVPGAERAELLGVCPAGARRNSGLDHLFTADDLLQAWRAPLSLQATESSGH